MNKPLLPAASAANTPPNIIVAGPLTRQAGTDGTVSALATVSDAETPAENLSVTIGAPPGITVNSIVNNNGLVSASIGATCSAKIGASALVLTVTDAEGVFVSASLTVNVTENPGGCGTPPPVAVSLGQATAQLGSSFDLTINGSGFVSGSQVRFNGRPVNTQFISAAQLTARVIPADLTAGGFVQVTVINPDGQQSSALTLTVTNPVPALTSLNPDAARVGTNGLTLTLNGSGFVAGSLVRWNSADRLTIFISSTQLLAAITPADLATVATASITVFNPAPGGGVSGALPFTVNPLAQADLSVTQTISPQPAGPNATVTFTISVANAGPTTATQVMVQDSLPTAVNFGACAATNGGICGGAGLSRTISFDSLAAGSTATITLTATVKCLDLTVPTPPVSVTLSNTVMVTSAVTDPRTDNNFSTANLTLLPAQARITLSSAAFDFNPAAAAREATANPAFTTFTIENSGCQQLLVSFNVNRTGADVSSGRITSTDDSVTFPLRVISSDGSLALVPTGQQYPVFGGQKLTFRLSFDPKIPVPAGRTTGLAAHQVIPDLITSALTINTGNGNPLTVPITARVRSAAKLLHPASARLAPLVVLQKTGSDEFTVECSLHDANLDANLIRYQFLDSAGRPILQPPDIDLNLSAAGLTRGQSVTIIKKFTGAKNNPQVQRVQVIVFDGEGSDTAVSAPTGTTAGRIVNVSAANFTPALATESIAAAFGANLSATTAVATTLPLPTRLGGARIFVTDSRQVERAAPLFFVSPGQINYLIPEGTAPGEIKVVAANDDGTYALSTLQLAAPAPGLFSAGSTGTGAAAALALRVKADHTLNYENAAEYDGQQFIARPLDFGPEAEQLYLVLFGTGIRGRSALSAVTARIGGTDVEVEYAGPQGGFAGLDQINLKLPRTLAGRGETDIVLTVDGKPANVVRVAFR
ncbi:MAG: hypothetical protein U0Z53_09820 [Blastocatellia bacterium]